MFQGGYLKFLCTIIAWICFSYHVKSQNLLVNTDFETLNNCSEYHQDCSPEAWFYIKPAITPLINNTAVPKPFSGKDLLIVPVENVYAAVNKRTFIYSMFCCPLQKGEQYKLAFYINTAGNSFYGLDFYLSNNEFTSYNFKEDSVKPTIHISKEDIVNELNGWNFVETIYTAQGNEKFILLGNLSKQKFDFVSHQRMNKAGDVFYFLDDITFTPLEVQPLCKEFKSNAGKLYAQNLRHTESVLADTIDNFKNIIIDTITVPAVFFETDKDILKPAFKKLIDELVNKFKDNNISSIKIDGHTDNTGTKERNITLSKLRAESVKKYFIYKMKNNSFQILADGKASDFPVADNISEKGRAKNRRVQIIISYFKETKSQENNAPKFKSFK